MGSDSFKMYCPGSILKYTGGIPHAYVYLGTTAQLSEMSGIPLCEFDDVWCAEESDYVLHYNQAGWNLEHAGNLCGEYVVYPGKYTQEEVATVLLSLKSLRLSQDRFRLSSCNCQTQARRFAAANCSFTAELFPDFYQIFSCCCSCSNCQVWRVRNGKYAGDNFEGLSVRRVSMTMTVVLRDGLPQHYKMVA